MKRAHYIWCMFIAGILGFVFYCVKAETIFPSASIDVSLQRAKIVEIAADWAKQLGYKETDPIKSTVFTFDDDAKTFLEYELGSRQANELMRTQIPVWYWSSRICKPLKQDEFVSSIGTQGKLYALENTIPNDRALPSLSLDDARNVALAFAQGKGGIDMSKYHSIEEGSVKQKARTDFDFTWEDTAHEYHGAKERVHAYVSGNQLTSFNHFLNVPEAWTRKFTQLRSYNDALAAAASLFYYGIMFGAFFVFLWAISSGIIRWRFALVVSCLYAGITCLETINSLPSSMHGYDTSVAFSAFQLQFVFGVLSASLITFLSTLILVGCGEAIYRLMKPHDIAMEKLFTPTGLRSKSTIENIVVGLALFGLHLGWISLYYLAGRKLGFWSPLEVDNAESLSSLLPFFSAMEVGWSAGLSEEFAYRIIGLAAFKKIVRNFWVANFLQAAAWAFMHSNYPQEPPYARGVELTVVGFVYGAVLQRFGIMACFFSHNLLDTYMGIAPLLSSHIKSLQASAFIALIPFALYSGAAIWLVRKRGFADDEERKPLLNQSLSIEKEPPSSVVAKTLHSGYLYTPLSKKVRAVLAVITALSMGVCAFMSFPVIAQHVKLEIARDEAIKRARKVLVDHGVNQQELTVVAWLGQALSSEEMQYIYEQGKEPEANKLAMSPERPLWWSVRFFKPQVQEEFLVTLDQKGDLMSFTLSEPETAPGESESKEEAQKRVEKFLVTTHPEIVPFEFEDATQQKREHRIDYLFRYSVPKFKVGDARYMLSVDCIGGRVSGYDTSWNLPDNWVWKRSLTSLREQIFSSMIWVFGIVFLIALLIWGRGVVESRAIIWRPAIFVGLSVAAFSLVQSANELPLTFYQYKTNIPMVSFFVAQAVGYIVSAISTFAMGALVSAFGFAALRLLLADTSVSAIIKSSFTPTDKSEVRAHANLWIDAVLVGYAAALADFALELLSSDLRSHLSPNHTTAPLDVIAHYSNLVYPAIGALSESILRGVYYVFMIAIAVGLYAKYIRNFRRYAIMGLGLGILLIGSYKYWQDASIDFIAMTSSIAISWYFIARLARKNLLAYFFLGFSSVLIVSLRALGRYGGPLFTQDCIAIFVCLLAPAIYAIVRATGLRSAGNNQDNADSVDVETV